MLKPIASILTLFALFSVCRAQNLEDPTWVRELAPKRIVYSVPGMNQIRVRKDLIYKRASTADLKMDVYLPQRSRVGAPAAAVLFIHGGRIPASLRTTPKDWNVYVSFGQLVAASGFVGVTFNHRFHTWDSFPDSQNDISDAIQYVRQHADALGVDRNRIVMWAVSAGGIFLSRPLRDHPPFIKCLVAYYPELNLQNARSAAPPSVTDEMLRQFSPVAVLASSPILSAATRGTNPNVREGSISGSPAIAFPSIFIARAGLDDADLNAGVDLFVKLALERNLSLELMNHPTGHHGFDIEDNNDRSREIIKRTIEFIREHSL